ncbi:carboxylate-amine ligase [Acuticoccus sp. MNP-M23]|uniref:carboxylate-amine ligase n=1 Tax=Acuticoccus sp. MNP-M23 TaxID=3072793 RepID=UPI002815048B|nr:carboxylate-amine ligase [Acuticoccus sp. MNP-M23]WMS41312.1 carboxylate-amine ligase [Acuticoccus sp. MNP-M23]
MGEKITIGVEEEYLLIDPETRALASRPPKGFMARCKEVLGNNVTHEFLQSQVEIGTGVCHTVADARAELITMRRAVAEAAKDHGMRMIAASTHPWAHWQEQEPVDMERYRIIGAEHRSLARRMSICGMHVHAGIEDKNLRVDLMGQVTYFMPHLLALSTSSPFWEGHDTGLKAFRPIIIGDLPRSGLPETFESWSDWTELTDDLAATGMVTDPSKIWWDIRPSSNHPTLELRVCDICTYVEDGLTIAALYQATLAFLLHLRKNNQRWRQYRRLLVQENKWRAQRYGVEAELGDFGIRKKVPFADLVEEMIELLGDCAEAVGCRAEVENARQIVARGTSADHQLKIYNTALEAGESDREAQVKIVDWLVEQSVAVDTPTFP